MQRQKQETFTHNVAMIPGLMALINYIAGRLYDVVSYVPHFLFDTEEDDANDNSTAAQNNEAPNDIAEEEEDEDGGEESEDDDEEPEDEI